MSIERIRERLALIGRMRGGGLDMSPSFSEQDVLELIAEIESLREARSAVECRFEVSEDTLKTIRGCLASAEADIDQLKVENKRLKTEAECAVAKQNHAEMIGDGFYHASEKLRVENEELRKDARRWQCVRNAIPMQSPYAVWREGSHLVLGKDADELVDNFLSRAKESGHD